MLAQRLAGLSLVFLWLATLGMAVGEAAIVRCIAPYPRQPVRVAVSNISVEVNGQVAQWQQSLEFHNPNEQAIVGAKAYLDIESGAQVDDMSVAVGGKPMRAEILDAERAKQVFQELVKEGGSPAVLGYYGYQLIEAEIPRIPAGGRATMQVRFSTVLKKQGDLLRLECLNLKGAAQPLDSAELNVTLRGDVPVVNVYSPTHPIVVDTSAEDHVAATWSAKDYEPDRPFVLYYQLAETPLAASLLTHRELDDEGTFLLLLSPTGGPDGFGPDDVLPKDVVFCVDTSGSMIQDGKIDQAKAALVHCLEQLRPGDRFNIVDFSTSVRAFSKEPLIEANDESIAQAVAYAQALSARGGTAIQEALEQSLAKLAQVAEPADSSGRVRMILFATDGQPTIGIRDPEIILRRVAERNVHDTRLFVFGEGYDVNTKLLDQLAANNQGDADYILPEEDIGPRIGGFFGRVGSPLVTDLQLEFEGVEVEEVHPRRLGDLYRGEQLVILGRYDGSGPAQLKLTGRSGATTRTATFALEFPEVSEDESHAFVPRLWAGRRVGDLIHELRVGGNQDDELIEEVTYLAKRYGIVTPYTSFLLADDLIDHKIPPDADVPMPRPRPLPEPMGRLRERIEAENHAPRAPEEKAERVRAAADLAETRRETAGQGGAAALDRQAARALRGLRDFRGDPRNGSEPVNAQDVPLRYVGTQAFYQQGSLWVDNRRGDVPAAEDAAVENVDIGSPRYFELLNAHPRLASAFALGEVLLPVEGRWVRLQRAR